MALSVGSDQRPHLAQVRGNGGLEAGDGRHSRQTWGLILNQELINMQRPASMAEAPFVGRIRVRVLRIYF